MADIGELNVKITAEIADLQAKLALAKENLNQANASMKTAAQQMLNLGTAADSSLKGKLSESAAATAAARIEVTTLGEKLKQSTENMLLASGTAQNFAVNMSVLSREGRALFDELTAGRTRMVPGTLAIIAQQAFGIGTGALVATAAVGGMVAALALLVEWLNSTATAMANIKTMAAFSGEMNISSLAVDKLTESFKKFGVGKTDALEIISVFTRMKDTSVPQIQLLSLSVLDFAAATGKTAVKAAEDLAKGFSVDTSAVKFLETLSGVTQEEVEVARGADLSGSALQGFNAKWDAFDRALQRSKDKIDENNRLMAEATLRITAAQDATSLAGTAEEQLAAMTERSNTARRIQNQQLAEARAALAGSSENSERILRTGVESARAMDDYHRKLEAAVAEAAKIADALVVAKTAGDQLNINNLEEGLRAAKARINEIELGPIVQRARDEVAKLDAAWTGLDSDRLKAEMSVWQNILSNDRLTGAERTRIQLEFDRTAATLRRQASAEVVSQARENITDINAAEGIGNAQRLRQNIESWRGVLTNEKLTAADRLVVQSSLNRSIFELNREMTREKRAIDRDQIEAETALSKLRIAEVKDSLRIQVSEKKISYQEQIVLLKELTQQEYELDINRIQALMSGLTSGTAEYQRYYNEIRVMRGRLNKELSDLDRQAATDAKRAIDDQRRGWMEFFGGVGSAWDTFLGSVFSRQQTLSAAGVQAARRMVQEWISGLGKIILQLSALKLAEAALGSDSFITKMLQPAAGSAAGAVGGALGLTGAASGGADAASKALEGAMVANTAATVVGTGATTENAASTIFAAAATDLNTGTGLVVNTGANIVNTGAVGALTTAVVANTIATAVDTAVPFETGAMNIPSMMLGLLHPGEMVVPAREAQMLRNHKPEKGSNAAFQGFVPTGGSPSSVTFAPRISAVDAKSVLALVNQPQFMGQFARSLGRYMNLNPSVRASY